MRAELEAMVETAARAICKEDGDCLCILDAECTCNIRSSLFAKYAIAALEAVTPTIEILLAEREREVREACAKVAEKRSEERFAEYGTREWDTNACYYEGRAAEIYEALDEEDEAIAQAIRESGK